MASITFKTVVFSSFATGLLGLALAIPGYLRDWNEFKVCEGGLFGFFETCQVKPYLLEVQPPKNAKLVDTHLGDPLTKIFGISLAVISFPLAAYASREMAEYHEEEEIHESIAKLASVENAIGKHSIDNKISLEGYEAMKAIDMANTIDAFRATYFQEASADELDSMIESDQLKIQQMQNYKRLEFDVESQEEGISDPKHISEGISDPKHISEGISDLKQPQDDVSSNSETVISRFTRFNLSRDEAIAEVLRLRNEMKMNQTEIIKYLWDAKPGENEAYRKALTEYKELTKDDSQ